MKKYIYDKLNEIHSKKMTSFHMPGHNNAKLFDELGYTDLMHNIYKLDTTEIIGTDNLHSPKEIIDKSQKQALKILFNDLDCVDNYELSYLVNGSTSGIEAAIMYSCKNKDKIIINRNCHQSAYNACIMANLEPIFVMDIINKRNSILEGSDINAYLQAIDNNPDAKAVFITRPTYYGNVFNLEAIIKKAHSKGMIVIVDEAHGAHLNLSSQLPKSALYLGADIVVQSLHKSLPTFTQTSIMVVDCKRININRMRVFLSMTQSSSPSYILMMSIEIGLEIYEKNGKALMEELLVNIDEFRKKQNKYKITLGDDRTKLFINTIDKGINGYDFAKLLRYEYNIQVELANYYGILLLCTIGNNEEDFNKLDDSINDIAKRKLYGPEEKNFVYFHSMDDDISDKPIRPIYMSKSIELNLPNEIPLSVLRPKQAMDLDRESIEIHKSLDRLCADFIIPYPPGVCLIGPGEKINKEIIDFIKNSQELKIDINGIESKDFKYISVIKDI
ncbi:aminotransferase class I/II-fold pyridoxal phosphate-dependent enzyme [Peptostreptococcus equinus]|uniref:Aminotransferase class V-fold PLP-dependent enzyme n=1 Tax=Peptostreptococcus equinus TaxID=3003601 RepID=A0ABY7JSW1_9FIRM|nr:aminotransferase class V-fold PLP-dependent enzyme [Peptostreptococcus sp. CBA3647]WAW15017.1 aminotransferase class V-fold PLP-dependent enzyme [Peptostreptococcus sp. CBA3647]